MERDTMYAISPLDGRYAKIGEELSPYFSEYALIKNRVMVEVKWLIFQLERIKFKQIEKFGTEENLKAIEKIYTFFNKQEAERIKEIESVTNHDVKAVELYVGEKLKNVGLEQLISFVHIGCTSDDINNTTYATMIKDGLNKVWIPKARELIFNITKIAEKHSKTPMLNMDMDNLQLLQQ